MEGKVMAGKDGLPGPQLHRRTLLEMPSAMSYLLLRHLSSSSCIVKSSAIPPPPPIGSSGAALCVARTFCQMPWRTPQEVSGRGRPSFLLGDARGGWGRAGRE